MKGVSDSEGAPRAETSYDVPLPTLPDLLMAEARLTAGFRV